MIAPKRQHGPAGKDATGVEHPTILADRGYFSGAEVLACEEAGVTPICPKPLTSGAKAEGRFGKRTSTTTRRATPIGALPRNPHQALDHIENGLVLNRYWSSHADHAHSSRLHDRQRATGDALGARHVVEAMQDRLDRKPDAMRIRRRNVEHVFGTIKTDGRSHFKMRRLANVGTEMSLHVLAYNMKRAIALLGAPGLIAAMRG